MWDGELEPLEREGGKTEVFKDSKALFSNCCGKRTNVLTVSVAALGGKPRALGMLSKHFTTELQPGHKPGHYFN